MGQICQANQASGRSGYGSGRPPFGFWASAVILALAAAGLPRCALAAKSGDEARDSAIVQVLNVLSGYRKALEHKSLNGLSELVTPDLTVIEGASKTVSWQDYRDNHIGPKMREWKQLRVLAPTILEVGASGDLAYAVQESTYSTAPGDESLKLSVIESFVLRRQDGAWRIKLIHFSAKYREDRAR